MIQAIKKFFRELFWSRCAYCGKKKKYYFWDWETNVVESPDFIEGGKQICINCAIKYIN